MTTVDAALAAMDTAEKEARDHLAYKGRELEYGAPLYVEDWARDRLRLIQRDRRLIREWQDDETCCNWTAAEEAVKFWTEDA